MLTEMLRVVMTGGSVEIICLHRLAHDEKKKLHVNQFNLTWFIRMLRRFGAGGQVTYSGYTYLPHPLFTLFRLPSEITVRFLKP